jgi:preprotein translocase subunit SecF
LNALGHSEAVVQKSGENRFLIRTKTLAEAERDALGNVVKPSEKELMEEALKALAPIVSQEFSSVSPIVAAEKVRNAAIATVAALGGMLLYLAWAFRRVPKPFRYATAAVLGLAYTVLVVMGAFSVMGKLIELEVNAIFIAGILTVVGYGVNDTVVVFDRIRENVSRNIDRPLEQTVNESLLQALARSLNTGLTTILAIAAILILGGPSLRTLMLSLLIGVVTSTYTSIFLSSPLLVAWEKGEIRGVFRFLRLMPRRSSP